MRSKSSSVDEVIKLLNLRANNRYFKIKSKPIKFKKLEFKNVYYSFPKTKNNVIQNVNIEICKGQKLGIVGKTGSGKSTIM